MELTKPIFLFFLLLIISSLSYSTHSKTLNPNPFKPFHNFSLSFPLHSLPLSHSSSSSLLSSSIKQISKNPNLKNNSPPSTYTYTYKSPFKYSMALIISLPIGTPPQTQRMVLDTGSQLSWIKCNDLKVPPKPLPPPPPPPFSSFDPSLSSSFSLLPCDHPICKPRIPDFTLPTSCDQNRFCHYSYFYADGTLAEGNLVREKITFSNSQITPPLILGCTRDAGATEGILGMNRGRLSFASQTKISKFSYCVPVRQNPVANTPAGTFYLGENPNSGGFQYVDLLTYSQSQSQRMPNFDPAAYTVVMEGIRISGKKLNISPSVFRPGPSGVGQTMIDSGTEYTFLVEEAYVKVREEVLRLVGPTKKLKRDFVYEGALDLCFDGDAIEIGRLVGDLVMEFEKGVEIMVGKERVFFDIGGGVGCMSIGRSDLLGITSNIIGNFHQQNLWVEFDVGNRRIGFGKADCSKTV